MLTLFLERKSKPILALGKSALPSNWSFLDFNVYPNITYTSFPAAAALFVLRVFSDFELNVIDLRNTYLDVAMVEVVITGHELCGIRLYAMSQPCKKSCLLSTSTRRLCLAIHRNVLRLQCAPPSVGPPGGGGGTTMIITKGGNWCYCK